MFSIAFLLGLYANCIFLFGLANLYQKPFLVAFTTIYLFLAVLFWKRFDEKLHSANLKEKIIVFGKEYPFWSLSIVIAVSIMAIGALSPETAYDALWYHLTLPKLYLDFSGVRFIPGGLFYYSAMPKVGEMFYTAALAFGTDVFAHFIHLFFGIITGVAIYSLTKKYTTTYFALIAIAVFFSNIVVLWEATTAYIDLTRTFFEVMALWGVTNYIEKKDKKWLIESAFLYGLAIETKLIAFASLPIFIIPLLFFGFKKTHVRIKDAFIFISLALLVPLPWFVFSFTHTGNPFYPLFSNYQITLGQDLLSFPRTVTDLFTVFINASDPISPIYLMLFPVVFLVWKKLERHERMLVLLSGASIMIWTLTPKTGGGRFMLPYLPLLTVTSMVIVQKLQRRPHLLKICLIAISIVSITSLSYRLVAQYKSLSVIFGFESRQEYLSKNLKYTFGDYYDTDHTLKQIVGDSTILLYGFHNLYYIDVPFIDSSYVKKGDTFRFIATQNTILPKRFSLWKPIYFDPRTNVMLYTSGKKWVY